eukprot:CAMPEP_0184435366 /NCGR_PEP_ID=MMETSP0738-20130409/486917_1 /TAXON_ID=385413 /ORGANISM="Thalassiosira miniscula, Strain CCMP1093" /LENGTH=138 /DNA_ID=CAMNT_0026801731 /DNA_START=68 /DNA_END=481 /DNA_ORIENTATION=+
MPPRSGDPSKDSNGASFGGAPIEDWELPKDPPFGDDRIPDVNPGMLLEPLGCAPLIEVSPNEREGPPCDADIPDMPPGCFLSKDPLMDESGNAGDCISGDRTEPPSAKAGLEFEKESPLCIGRPPEPGPRPGPGPGPG